MRYGSWGDTDLHRLYHYVIKIKSEYNARFALLFTFGFFLLPLQSQLLRLFFHLVGPGVELNLLDWLLHLVAPLEHVEVNNGSSLVKRAHKASRLVNKHILESESRRLHPKHQLACLRGQHH